MEAELRSTAVSIWGISVKRNKDLVEIRIVKLGACDEHLWDDHVKSIGQDARFPGHSYCCAFCSDQWGNNCGTVRPSFNLSIDGIGAISGCCRGARRLEQ